MDELDGRIIKALQHDFPLEERPYEVLAAKLGIPGEQLWARVEKLLDAGVIRRMGASLNSHKLGFASTLAAVSVEPGRVDEAAEVIGGYSEVTHSYMRNDRFNIWFTLITTDLKKISELLEEIRKKLDLEPSQVLNLPMKRIFKLNARFNVADKSR